MTLGATPVQVFIDGIAQLKDPHVLHKPGQLQRLPRTPNFDREARETVEFDGLPPLRRHRRFDNGETIKLVNVSFAWRRDEFSSFESMESGVGKPLDVFMRNGSIVCVAESGTRCVPGSDLESEAVAEINLKGGALFPGLTSFGAPLGLEEINLEPSTNDGTVPDALTGSVPAIVGGTNAIIRAVDGLAFNGRNLLYVSIVGRLPTLGSITSRLAYRNGVTRAITAPSGSGFIQGLSTAFFPGAENALDHRAILQEETALHVTVSHSVKASISTQIAALRQLLFESNTTAWQRVRNVSKGFDVS